MGRVVLEIPQDVNRVYRIDSERKAAAILEQLKGSSRFEQAVASGAIQLLTSRSSEEDDEVLGIWADRPESGQQIARKLRDCNNGR